MWLDATYRNEEWSIAGKLDKLNMLLGHVRFPSSTTRRPRSIMKFHKYKGNELRSLLLFVYSIFSRYSRSSLLFTLSSSRSDHASL